MRPWAAIWGRGGVVARSKGGQGLSGSCRGGQSVVPVVGMGVGVLPLQLTEISSLWVSVPFPLPSCSRPGRRIDPEYLGKEYLTDCQIHG